MGKNQGIIRLESGFKRSLTNSEKKRRYIYITNDSNVTKVLDEEFEIYDNKKPLGKKKIDKFGRIVGLSKVVLSIGDKEVSFKADNGKLYLEY